MGRPRTVDDHSLLDAAMHAFWADGYAGVSTRALEQATGLPASSLYHRYGSKEALFVAVLVHYVERVIGARIARHLAPETSGPEVEAGLREFFRSVYRSRGPYRACLVANTWQDPVQRVPAVAEALRLARGRLLAAFTLTLQRGIEAGTFRRDLPLEAAAGFLFQSLTGLLAVARDEADLARLDTQVDLMLGALH